jgi:ABC-2 type transport system permease protein
VLSAVRTEILKLTTLRTPWALTGAAVVSIGWLAVQPLVTSGEQGRPSIGTAGAELSVLAALSRGALFALVLGVLIMTGEYRHATMTSTLLQNPRRRVVTTAKVITAATSGAVIGLLGLAVTLSAGIVSGALTAPLVNRDVVLRAAGLFLCYPLFGVLGAGVGALLHRSQPLALLLPVAWLLVLEELVSGLLPRPVRPWTMSGLIAALTNDPLAVPPAPVWLGGLGLCGYALLLGVLAVRNVNHVDIGEGASR